MRGYGGEAPRKFFEICAVMSRNLVNVDRWDIDGGEVECKQEGDTRGSVGKAPRKSFDICAVMRRSLVNVEEVERS